MYLNSLFQWPTVKVFNSESPGKQVTYLNQPELSQASPSCPLASSALHLHLFSNPQSLSSSFTASASYLLHPLYQFLSLRIPLQTRMPSLLGGCLDSVTHHGAGVHSSLVLLLSSHTVCPSGLCRISPVRRWWRGKQVKEGNGETWSWEEVRSILGYFQENLVENNALSMD